MLARRTILVVWVTLIVSLAGMFTMPVVNRDEARYVQASTQMMESGDYLHIRFQDQARNKKPAGVYWLQALSVQAFSHVQDRAIWAYRLPSVLFAILAALATFWGGRVLVGERAAFAGALLLSLTLVFGFESSTAKTDATLLGLTTLAMAALAQLRHGGGRRMAMLFWLALGGSVLVKGPVGPALAVLVLLSLVVWERKANWMRPLLFWPGPVLFLATFVPWLIAIQMATNGAFLQQSIGHDFLGKLASGQESHGAPPGTYLATLAIFAFPLTFVLLPALGTAWKNRRSSETGMDVHFLIAWFLPFWILLELTSTKLPHYPLPLYPALALLGGLALVQLPAFRVWARISAVLALLVPALLVAFVASPNLLVPAMPVWHPDTMVIAMTILAGLFTLAAFVSVWTTRSFAVTLSMILACGLLWQVSVRGLILPKSPLLSLPDQISQTLLTAGLHPRLSPGAPHPVQLVEYHPPSLVFDLGTDTVMSTKDSAAYFADQGARTMVWSDYDCAVPETDDLRQFILAMEKQNLCLEAPMRSGRGFNYSKGKCTTYHVFRLQTCVAETVTN